MPHGDDHDRSAQEQLEARARRGQHSSRDPGKTRDTQTRALFWLYSEFFTALFFEPPRTRVAEGHTYSRPVCGINNRHKVAVRRVVLTACGWLQILGPDGCITGCFSVLYQPPGVLGSIPKREEPGKTGAPCVKVPGSSTVPEKLQGGCVPYFKRTVRIQVILSFLIVPQAKKSGIFEIWPPEPRSSRRRGPYSNNLHCAAPPHFTLPSWAPTSSPPRSFPTLCTTFT